jgi:hypothetical protein
MIIKDFIRLMHPCSYAVREVGEMIEATQAYQSGCEDMHMQKN